MNKKLSLGFSSCPNDTFIFDALIHHKIDTEGLEFEVFIADVEELNKKAFAAELDITKISFNAFTRLTDKYLLLDSGAALGENCGPLIIAKEKMSLNELKNKRIVIPGFNTTANLLMSFAFPEAKQKTELLFSEIENAVLQEKADAGLIIHESRFTYADKGLIKLADVGEIWEHKTQTPTPLGGIIVRKDLDKETLLKINRSLKRAVLFAFEHPKSGLNFIRQHAQEMSEEVMYKHIGLYVNDYTKSLQQKGKDAVLKLFEVAKELGNIKNIPNRSEIFVD